MFESCATIHSQVQGLADSVTGQRWTKSKCPGEGSGIGNSPSYTHNISPGPPRGFVLQDFGAEDAKFLDMSTQLIPFLPLFAHSKRRTQ